MSIEDDDNIIGSSAISGKKAKKVKKKKRKRRLTETATSTSSTPQESSAAAASSSSSSMPVSKSNKAQVDKNSDENDSSETVRIKGSISATASSKKDEATSQNSKNSKKSKSKSKKTPSAPPPPPPNSFESIQPPLSSSILSCIHSHYKFQSMTPVQSSTIPLFLQNKDVVVHAVTGSGKTLAFLIPAVEMILRRTCLLTARQVGALVISPTRELARQTYVVACTLCQYTSLTAPLLLVGGGSGYRPVKDDLTSFHKQRSDIVIGTPGRIDDVLSRFDDLQMNELECLILDEADVLLAMGFEVTLTNILSRLPKMRRTGLFSATKSGTEGSGSGSSSAGVRRLIGRAGLRNPVMINVAIASSNAANANTNDGGENDTQPSTSSAQRIAPQEQATPTSLTNYYIISKLDEQLSRLVAFLHQHRDEKIIVFFMTCANVEYFGLALSNLLSSNKFYIELLHGKLAPKRREKAMERFRNGGVDDKEHKAAGAGAEKKKGGILLCTDVAARGLDVPDIQWTVQFDAPVDPSQYIHRVGRSARAGRTGSSLIFLSPKEESFIDFLRMRKVPIQEIDGDGGERCSPSVSIVKKTQMVDGEDSSSAAHGNGNESENESDHGGKIMIPDILARIRKMVLNDRDLLEKGTKAFTSYIRAYKEHKMQFIFRFASLDLGVLATSFSLLKLPKMPELKDKVGKLNFKSAGPEIDIHGIKFKDKVREKARQKRLAVELAQGGKNAKQIKAEQRTAAKLQREKDRRQTEIGKGRNPNKKRGKQARIFDEWDELAKEERLHKKLKRGKITKAEFKTLMYGDKGSKEEEDDMMDSDMET